MDVVAAAIVLGSLTTTNRRAIMMRVCVFECLFLVLFIFTMSFFLILSNSTALTIVMRFLSKFVYVLSLFCIWLCWLDSILFC